jgi:hypothetical protein
VRSSLARRRGLQRAARGAEISSDPPCGCVIRVLQWGSVEYRGVPVSGLRIDAIEWTEDRAEHIRTRTKRYGPGQIDVEPEWATEAATDPVRLAGPAQSGESLQVVGWSGSCGRILKVWLFPKDMEAGEWYGASACEANDTNKRRYNERKGGQP